jgi:hypothetical protein
MQPGTVFVIDGSGNADQQEADKKRPIFQLDVRTGSITRPLLLGGQSALQFLTTQVESQAIPRPILIASDVPIGLPAVPEDVFTSVAAVSFLTWLDSTARRLEESGQGWRDLLIAKGVGTRTGLQPFVSIAEKEDKTDICFLRRCDRQSHGESVYCLDHGPKQVGRAALQFWFEVLVPLRIRYGPRLAVWPFEALAKREIIVGECYPKECHRMLYGTGIKKRQSLEVAKALCGLLRDPVRSSGIELGTWIHAASSEGEFDMFTTAVAFRELLGRREDLFSYPADDEAYHVMEGWMLGLPLDAAPKLKKSRWKRPLSPGAVASGGIPSPGRNRHNQQDLGRSGNRGPKGPLHRMKCHCPGPGGSPCGHEYETNAQDVFQKKCPVCQK